MAMLDCNPQVRHKFCDRDFEDDLWQRGNGPSVSDGIQVEGDMGTATLGSIGLCFRFVLTNVARQQGEQQ